MSNQDQEIKIGCDVITSKGLFGRVTNIEGDRIYVKLGSKEVPIFKNQLTVSLGKMPFHITYKLPDDDAEYTACIILNKHSIVFDKDRNLQSIIETELFNQTAKHVILIQITIA